MFEDQTILLTRAGHARLEAELDRLRTIQRREIAERIRNSKQFGDLTENSEYENAKAEQAMVEGRIQEIKRILQFAQVVDDSNTPVDQVGVGSIVKLKDDSSGEEWEITLVGSIETDPELDRISDHSPIGQALMGRKTGDRVQVRIPDGVVTYTILDIRR